MNVKVVPELLIGIRGRYPGNVQVHIVMDGLPPWDQGDP